MSLQGFGTTGRELLLMDSTSWATTVVLSSSEWHALCLLHHATQRSMRSNCRAEHLAASQNQAPHSSVGGLKRLLRAATGVAPPVHPLYMKRCCSLKQCLLSSMLQGSPVHSLAQQATSKCLTEGDGGVVVTCAPPRLEGRHCCSSWQASVHVPLALVGSCLLCSSWLKACHWAKVKECWLAGPILQSCARGQAAWVAKVLARSAGTR